MPRPPKRLRSRVQRARRLSRRRCQALLGTSGGIRSRHSRPRLRSSSLLGPPSEACGNGGKSTWKRGKARWLSSSRLRVSVRGSVRPHPQLRWFSRRRFFSETGASEPSNETTRLDSAYVPIERIDKEFGLFEQLVEIKPRIVALFGKGRVEPFDEFLAVRWDIIGEAHMLSQMRQGNHFRTPEEQQDHFDKITERLALASLRSKALLVQYWSCTFDLAGLPERQTKRSRRKGVKRRCHEPSRQPCRIYRP